MGSSDRLTMRAVAKEVGTSAPSIYLHFHDKTELVWAALEDRYGALSEQMAAAAQAEDRADPQGRTRAQAHAYCRFALSSHTAEDLARSPLERVPMTWRRVSTCRAPDAYP